MCAVKFFLVIQAIYILPAATFKGLHVCRKTYIIENTFPVEWISEVAKAFTSGIIRQFIGWENNCFWYWYVNIYSKSIVEELFISTPPKGIVDNSSTPDSRVFKVGTIERDILANAVNNNCVR